MASSFAQNQFGKSIDTITLDDLMSFFSEEREESLTLEFKSFVQHENDIKHKENGVLRTICGFLNSNGGLLIWGAPVGSKNKNGQKIFTGLLSPVEKLYSKDELISKISNRIIPFAAPIRFHSIEMDQGKFIYLLDVPESESKPHQFENTYYMRLDGQTKPAPHYIIDALFKQIRIPNLSGYLRITGLEIGSNAAGFNSTKFSIELVAVIFNDSLNTNDTGLYITFVTEKAKFLIDAGNGSYTGSETNKATNCVFTADDSRVKITESDRIVTYALPITYKVRLEFIYRDHFPVTNDEDGLKYSIIFGSALSNTKISEYTLKLSRNVYSTSQTQNYTNVSMLNNLLRVTKQENDYLKDYMQISEQAREEILPGL